MNWYQLAIKHITKYAVLEYFTGILVANENTRLFYIDFEKLVVQKNDL